MNSPLTQVDIEGELMRLLADLERQTEEFGDLALDCADKEAKCKGAWAKHYLMASGSIRQREALADVAVDELTHQHKIADALMKSARERLTSLRTAIDALRTLNANVRVQV